MSNQTLTFIGGGECFIGPYDGSGPLRFLGEASKVELSFSEDKKTPWSLLQNVDFGLQARLARFENRSIVKSM